MVPSKVSKGFFLGRKSHVLVSPLTSFRCIEQPQGGGEGGAVKTGWNAIHFSPVKGKVILCRESSSASILTETLGI